MFSDIKVGDKVTFHTWGSFGGAHTYNERIVSSVAKTTFKLEKCSYTFNKKNGHEYGNYYSRNEVLPYDEDMIKKSVKDEQERKEKVKLQQEIKGAMNDLYSFTLDELKAIQAALPKKQA